MTAEAPVAELLLERGWEPCVQLPELDDAEPGPARIRQVAATEFSVLAIPEEFGGGGVGLPGVAAAQRLLGRHDPSTAIALNMHSLTLGLMVDYWDRHRDTSWLLLEGIAERHALVASAFAEPGGSANFLRSVSVARPSEKGYVVNGTKYPCSLATTADLFCVSAQVESTSETIIALCPAESPGLTTEGEWPSLGMRASDTGRMVMRDVEIDSRLVFHRGDATTIDDVVIAGIVWFAVLVVATYHGVLTSLVTLAAQSASASGGSHREQLVGQAIRELLMLGLSAQSTARLWDAHELCGREALAAAVALRANLSSVRDRVVNAITPVLGSRMYTAVDQAGRFALDSLAVHHHPPSLLACDEAIGAFAVGKEMRLDPST